MPIYPDAPNPPTTANAFIKARAALDPRDDDTPAWLTRLEDAIALLDEWADHHDRQTGTEYLSLEDDLRRQINQLQEEA